MAQLPREVVQSPCLEMFEKGGDCSVVCKLTSLVFHLWIR